MVESRSPNGPYVNYFVEEIYTDCSTVQYSYHIRHSHTHMVLYGSPLQIKTRDSSLLSPFSAADMCYMMA